MKHHACITIGINQYQYLQPLSYAQEDAEALHSFLVGEADFSPEGCLLLTDTSPATAWGQPTYPNRENILKLTESLCRERLPQGDILWCFFSGYGVSYSGEDYLMPIDGNPADVGATGISVRSLFEAIKAAPTETVMVLLDFNRSQGTKAGETIGAFTEELAREMEIPTLLSCRPNQVSRETSALRHGFFTAALLEGLRSGQCSTIKGLEHYLNDRLPELSEHHLRPRQDPAAIVYPPGKIHQVILPDSFQAANTLSAVGRNGAVATVGAGVQTLNQSQVGATTTAIEPTQVAQSYSSNAEPVSTPTEPTPDSGSSQPMEQNQSNSERPANEADREAMSDRSFLQQLILWSGATALVLLLGVFIANRSVFLGQGEGDPKRGETAQKAVAPGATQNQAKQPMAGTVSSQPLNVSKPVSAKPTAQELPSSQAVLDRAKVLLKDSSASSLSDAIAQARKIPGNDPLYPEAQVSIERWSQMILDIANGRAGQKNFPGAVAAAKLIPDANQQLHQQAQKAISFWQGLSKQQQANAALLAAAKGKIKRGVASSYNQAIEQASKIQPEQPGYSEAQKLIAEWSDVILNIAQLRASQGRLADAIEAGKLVPKGTAAYTPAQKAIADWQQKLQPQKKG